MRVVLGGGTGEAPGVAAVAVELVTVSAVAAVLATVLLLLSVL